jgi:predicted XRE-type DNA-binding protein
MNREASQKPKAMKPDYEIGSRNVYADLGRPGASTLLIKAQLVNRISEILEERGLTQVKAAALLGIPQPKLSACSPSASAYNSQSTDSLRPI